MNLEAELSKIIRFSNARGNEVSLVTNQRFVGSNTKQAKAKLFDASKSEILAVFGGLNY